MFQTKRFSGLVFLALDLFIVVVVLMVDLANWPVAVLFLGLLIAGVVLEIRGRRTTTAR